MAEEPVEIDLRLNQDVDTEAKKAADGMDDVAEASAKAKQEFEKNLAAQQKVINDLTAEVAKLRSQLSAPVKTDDTKLILEKEKLTQTVAELEKKLKQAEAAYASLQVKGKAATTATNATTKATANAVGTFNNLNFSVQQVARELPVLAISPQMFIMAISNNLPILQDQLKKTRLQNEALKASGQSTVPVWKQLLKSLVSWQTTLVVGITLLTVYGKEITQWVKRMFNAAESINLTTKELKAMKDELAKGLGSELGKLNSLFDKLKEAEKGTYDYYKAKKDIIGQYSSYLSGLDAEKRTLEDVEGAYKSLTIAIQDQAREKALNSVYEQQGEQLVKASTEQLEKIRAEFLDKFGKDTGETFFQSLKKELQSGSGLSEGMKRMIASFTITGSNTFVGNTGAGTQAAYEYNNVADAIDKIVRAQDVYNGKIADAQSILGSLYGSNSPQMKSLIEEQQLLLDQAKLMPESTEAEIEAKNKKIETIENEIKRLKELGKTDDKAIKEIEKEISAKEKAADELLKIQTRLEEETAAATIAAMQEGADKKLAQIDAEYTERKNRIAERLAEIEKLEEKTGVTSVGNREQLARLAEAEKAKYEAAVKAVESEARTEVDAVFADVNERFNSQLNNQFNKINAYYAEQLQAIKENSLTADEYRQNSAELEDKRLKELAIAREEYNLQSLSFEEEIALKRQELANESLIWETDKQKKLLQLQLKYAMQRMNALNRIQVNGGDAEEEIKRLRAEIERLNKELGKTDGMKLMEIADTLGRSLRTLSSAFSEFPGALGEIGDAMGNIADNADNLSTILDENASKTDIISAGVSGLANLFSMVAGQIAENKELQAEWNDKIKEAAHQAALARIELEAYQEGNIFGIENPYSKAIAGAQEYAAAMGELQKAAGILSQGQVQTGQKKVVSGKNIATGAASGAAAGAALGTVVPVIGTAVGAVVGGIVGAIFGAASKKMVPVFESLSKKYGEIYDKKTFELNPAILEDYAKLDEATKKLVDNWEEIRAKAKEAEEQVRNTFKELAGDIGDRLSNALVNAFRNNDLTNAMNDFESSVSNIIENIISQLVIDQFFKGMIDEMQKGFNDSFGMPTNGEAADPTKYDENIIDDIIKFTEQYAEAIPGYMEAMKAAREEMRKQGIDVFEADRTRTPSSKGIAQASQDTVDELNGRITNIQQMIYDIRSAGNERLSVSNELLAHQRMIRGAIDTIAENSEFLKKLSTIDNSLADITLKGVKIKQ